LNRSDTPPCLALEHARELAAHKETYAYAIRQARQAGTAAFHAWFNRESARTMQQYVVRGYWDFALHILTPDVCARLTYPEAMTALEIGYGGGRLLNAACNFFGEVVGIDIHDEHEAAAAFLRAQQHTNFRLLPTDGATIEVDAGSIDFVYSFIVLQHLPSLAVFASYLREVRRCLRPGGVAQLYFGKFRRLHPLYQLRYFWQGYKETRGGAANQISLVIRLARVRRMCSSIGLKPVASGTSYYLAPGGYPQQPGGQSFVTLVRE
jgi:SAM-dependent methyltransferase